MYKIITHSILGCLIFISANLNGSSKNSLETINEVPYYIQDDQKLKDEEKELFAAIHENNLERVKAEYKKLVEMQHNSMQFKYMSNDIGLNPLGYAIFLAADLEIIKYLLKESPESSEFERRETNESLFAVLAHETPAMLRFKEVPIEEQNQYLHELASLLHTYNTRHNNIKILTDITSNNKAENATYLESILFDINMLIKEYKTNSHRIQHQNIIISLIEDYIIKTDINTLSEKTQFDLFTIAVSHEDQKEGLKLLNTLIKNSANVNCRGEYGKTPLIYLMIGTITTSQIDLTDTRLEYLIKKITLLIQNGADPDICTFTGRNVVCLLAIASNLWKGQVTEFTWKTLFNLLVTNKNYNKRDKLGTALEITGDTVFSKLFKEYIEEKGFLNI